MVVSQTPRITAIEQKKKDPRRYAIFIDGEFAAGVSEEVIVRLNLRAGEPMTAPRRAELAAAEQDSQTRQAALKLLEYRARSRQELVRRLRKKCLPADSVGRVVADLERSGLIDDEQFARQLTRSLMTGKYLGVRAILRKLRQAGVDLELARQVCEDELGQYDEQSRAEQAASQHLPRLAAQDPATRRQRLYGYLQRRGFPHHIISEVIQKLGAEER